MNLFPPNLSDMYKVSHRQQYPAGTEVIYSNLTPRSSRLEGIDKVVFFGLQYFLREYLEEQFHSNFFGLHETSFDRMLSSYKRRLDNALGGDNDVSHWRSLRDLGYLPLEIKALPEGSLVPLRVPLLTVRNTSSEFFWLGQWIETLLCNVLWHPITTATLSYQYRKIVSQYAEETSDMMDFVPWVCHDFSMRGQTSVSSSIAGGAGHLVNFYGTDTIPSIDFLEKYYDADSDKELIGGSIPSTEHSVMCIGGEEGEFDTYRRLLTEVYPSGNIGIVSDTYSLWRVLTEYMPRLKGVILSRKGKTVCRPDSGVPEKILCGDPSSTLVAEQRGVVQLLWDVFGGRVNHKGYKQLHDNVGAIYGDSITLDRCKNISQGLKDNGFANTNVCLGIGSFTYQMCTRDTFGLAFKATSCKIDNQWRAVYKDPITDNGLKRSARGLLSVRPKLITDKTGSLMGLGDYELHENVSEAEEASKWNCLQPVYRDGMILRHQSLMDIRSRLHGQ